MTLGERYRYAFSQKDKGGHYKGDKIATRKKDAKGNLIEYTHGHCHKYINGVKIY